MIDVVAKVTVGTADAAGAIGVAVEAGEGFDDEHATQAIAMTEMSARRPGVITGP